MSPIDLIGFLGILVGLGGATYFEGAALAASTLACCIGLQRSAVARTRLPHHGIPGAMIALVVVIVLGSLVGSF